jgi:type II secretory ATPase GspE/PulE/Tfp pilus assembly ATPase PilB-like protein
MRRLFLVLLLLAIVSAAGAQTLLAQGINMPEDPIRPGWSGPGYYLSWVKILACWLVFLGWVFTTDWVSRDGMNMRLDYLRWNPIVFGSFLAAMVLIWLGLPWFWLAFFLLLAAYVGPLTAYILYRNSKVERHQRVLTREHLRHWFSARASTVGVKIEAEAKADYEKGPPLLLEARGKSQQEDQARLIAARQHPGFNPARKVLAEALDRRADAVLLDFTPQAVALRYQIDGVWHNGEPLTREDADPMLESLKVLNGLKPADRQSKQEGTFTTKYKAQTLEGKFASQGTQTGERAVMQLEHKKTLFKTLDDLGMRAKLQEGLKEVLSRERGFVVLSAMPATGLRTTTAILLRSQDRLMREFMAVEDEGNRYDEVENVPVTTYKGAEGESPASTLVRLFRMDPQVVVVRDLVNAETVSMLCQEISNEKRIAIGTVRAKDCAEALLRVLALKVPPEEFAPCATGVLNQRLIRKLCDKCKEAYQPTPQVLQQLGIPQGKVQALYRPPQPTAENPNPKPCEECNGIGYKGRTGLFEFWAIDDAVRQVLATAPKLDALRKAAYKAGMRSMQEEGILLVAKGVTSLPELMRVLKL